MSELGVSLLDYLNNEEPLQSLEFGVPRDCVMLLVKVLSRDILREVSPIVLPESKVEINGALCRFMEENYRKKITSADFARAFPLSFRQLSRTFKSDMGLTIFEYLKVLRMVMASICLNTTDMKITSVAYECGYDSISSFFTDFRKTFGLSPGDFRGCHR